MAAWRTNREGLHAGSVVAVAAVCLEDGAGAVRAPSAARGALSSAAAAFRRVLSRPSVAYAHRGERDASDLP